MGFKPIGSYQTEEGTQPDVTPQPKAEVIQATGRGFRPLTKTSGGATGTWKDESLVQKISRNIPDIVRPQILEPVVGSAVDTIKQAIPNIPDSGAQYVKNIASAFVPEKESFYIPTVATATNISNMATGAVQKLIPGEQGKEKYAEAIGRHFIDRYGSVENLRQTVIKDPVGFADDISSLYSLGGFTASKVGKVAGMPGLAAAGKNLSKIGQAIEPLNVAIKMSKPVVKIAGSLASQVHGRFMTGAGSEATKAAFRGSEDFINALRENIHEEDIVRNANDAVKTMRSEEVLKYSKEFKKVKAYSKPMDLNKIKEVFSDPKIQQYINPSRTPLDQSQVSALNNIKGVIDDWGDNTAAGFDSLKQNIDNFYKGSKDSRQYDSVITQLRNKVKSEIIKAVPEYEKITKDYSKFVKLENEISSALSLGDNKSIDTAARKLLSTMRENFEVRNRFVKHLENIGGQKLLDQLAGVTMQSYVPKGLIGKMESGLVAHILLLKGFDPFLGTLLFASSPRISGEILHVLGKTYNTVGKGVRVAKSPITTTARQILSQTEKINEDLQE
jgi:hypothetical protein